MATETSSKILYGDTEFQQILNATVEKMTADGSSVQIIESGIRSDIGNWLPIGIYVVRTSLPLAEQLKLVLSNPEVREALIKIIRQGNSDMPMPCGDGTGY